ncbi:PREDICTED: 26S proteasome non-ATPase regulatory subunit 2-like [Nicrophorus vespilloides]|uniref:26S proteasome non-ATPase regulatory subunit 2 n=1 Tax=Nicrophorus vespilloides TaxID=110193 RepID=A0ABM1MX89_NICVS|nr:PREDICTED: 26S proteasome non-ATPase regulatory subunit 2-like [Nicrophorus vespilloides]
MATVDVLPRKVEKTEELSEEDKELQDELKTLIDKIVGADPHLVHPALEMLKFLIRTSTTSMTSVPKPLKYLAPYYETLKEAHGKMVNVAVKKQCADIISVLAMCPMGGTETPLESLKYCMLGTMQNIGDWGHEYVHHIETQIVEQLLRCQKSEEKLENLIEDCVRFDCEHHGEIQACDFLMEIDHLEKLEKYLNAGIYQRVCMYLTSCAKYVDEIECEKIYKLIGEQYFKYEEYIRAAIIAIHLNKRNVIEDIFRTSKDGALLRQLAFICGRHLLNVTLPDDLEDRDELMNIMNNGNLSSQFLTLARELDIMDPKSPEDVYKVWLEPTPMRPSILAENIDSARQNLASSFVNGFVNAGFGNDKLVSGDSGNRWIYRNKENGMLSATASLGLVHLWDVDGGLTPIDKYLYSNDELIKSGALLALGIVNCRVRNECDPALALLADFISDKSSAIRNSAVLGLGLAYVGTDRQDVTSLLIVAVENATTAENFATACLAIGLVCANTCNAEASNAILTKLVDWRENEQMKSTHMVLAVLGLGFLYLGRKDAIDATCEAVEVFEEPHNAIFKSLLHLCAYTGTGDVFIIQEMLSNIGDRVNLLKDEESKLDASSIKSERKKNEIDSGLAQAIPVLGLGCVSLGEDMGTEMCSKILGSVGRYGDPAVRRAVPLAIAMNSVSKPHLPVIEVLTKYSHDSDEKVACNAIFALGIVGAGTNNARLAATLRQLAVYHARNAAELFMVRISQGLTHLGKGTLSLSPLHTDRLLLDYCSIAALLIPMISLLDPHAFILGQHHYLLYSLAAGMTPRWLITLDENLEHVSVPVRVGQAVDVVGKAGTPKTIVGIHTHTTPVLLACGERAELATEQYEAFGPTLDGICVLRKRPDYMETD